MFNFQENPCWPLEVIAALERRDYDDYDVIMEHPEKFGKDELTMKETFAPYLKYKKAVMGELNQIFSRYKEVEHYLIEDAKIRYELLTAITMVLVDQTTFDKLDKSILSNDSMLKTVMAKAMNILIADQYNEEDGEYELKDLEEPSKVVKYLGKVNIDNDLKFKSLELYLNIKEILPTYYSMIELMIDCLKKHYYLIENEYTKRMEEAQQPEFTQALLSGGLGVNIELGVNESYHIVGSIFHYNFFSLRSLTQEENGIELIEVGMLYHELVSEKQKKNYIADSEMTTICKALGDPNRYRMLQLFLKNEKMYLQELAKAIEVTPATASHHLALLIEAEVITMLVNEKEKKVVYYKANRERLNRIAQKFNNMAEITCD